RRLLHHSKPFEGRIRAVPFPEFATADRRAQQAVPTACVCSVVLTQCSLYRTLHLPLTVDHMDCIALHELRGIGQYLHQKIFLAQILAMPSISGAQPAVPIVRAQQESSVPSAA